PAQDFFHEFRLLRGFAVANIGQIELHGENVVARNAKVGGAQSQITFQEQTRAHQQDDSESNLRRQERAPLTRACVAAAVAARRFLKWREQRLAADTPDRNQPAEERAENYGAGGERRNRGVDVNAVHAIHVRTGVDEPGDRPAGDEDTNEPATGGEQETFDETFAKKTHSAGSHGGPDRQLFAPRSRAGNQQASHVQTGDKQDAACRRENDQQRSAVIGN